MFISCFGRKIEKQKQNVPNILTTKQIDSLIMNQIEEKGTFDWFFASDDMIYSAAMHGDSTISITYTIYDDKSRMYEYYGLQNLTDEWIQKRDEIIQDILEEEQRYRGESKLNIVDLLPTWKADFEDRFPNLSIKITSPKIIQRLRKNEAVTSIVTGYRAHTIPYRKID